MSSSDWRMGENPDVYQRILVELNWSIGERYRVCRIDKHGNLIESVTHDDLGYTVDDIEKWCPMDVVLQSIGG